MTIKEKAKELVIKMYSLDAFMTINMAKDSALICVNEIQNTDSVWDNDAEYRFYEEVKQEIKLL